jgi:uncharacterized protein YjbI with pentapeptide repeats
MADSAVAWKTCAAKGCIGIRLSSGGRCWAHANDSDLEAALRQLSQDGRLNARGVPITQDLLERLFAAAPHDEHGRPVLEDAEFSRATFQDDAWFLGIIFEGDAHFAGAVFQGNANFSDATFNRIAEFGLVTFQDFAAFTGTTFMDARFSKTAFQDEVAFSGAMFQDHAAFDQAAFQDDAWFVETTFQRDAAFARTIYQGSVRFTGATFQRARQLGPMLVRKGLVLDHAVFHERAQIEASAAVVCCQRARFLAGVQLRLRWAQVVLDDADLAAPSILTGVPEFPGLEEGRWAQALERLLPRPPRIQPRVRWRPRLLSLRGADVSGLTLADVDLRGCRFAGAHHLDQLRFDHTYFGFTPWSWRWIPRMVIAEERYWRADHRYRDAKGVDVHAAGAVAGRSGRAGWSERWYGPAFRPPVWLDAEPASLQQTAVVYRALRKGREDSKDEPGAADFYYGEMEMRRFSRRVEVKWERRERHFGHWVAAVSEHAVLWLYWLVCGYGLRAWRALATLAIVVLLAGGAFAFWGFAAPSQPAVRPVAVDARGAPIYVAQPVERPAGLDELATGVRFSAQTATALLRGPDRQLTALGEWLHLALRLTGPVLLGLAVLSIRGRVKR